MKIIVPISQNKTQRSWSGYWLQRGVWFVKFIKFLCTPLICALFWLCDIGIEILLAKILGLLLSIWKPAWVEQNLPSGKGFQNSGSMHEAAEHIDTGALWGPGHCGPAQNLSEPLTKALAKKEMLGVAGLLRSTTMAWSSEGSMGTGTSLTRPAPEEGGRKAYDQVPTTQRGV